MRRLLALGAVCALAACAKPATTAPASTGGGTVGFVRMGDLVRHHPLYAQLSQYDDGISALNLEGTVPHAVKADPEVAKAEADLQKQLEAAAAHTKALLDEKQQQYQKRESAAVAAALAASGIAPGAGAVANQIGATARVQSSAAASQAQRDFETYRRELEAQSRAELAAAQKTITDRGQRTFRAKQEELQAKEAALTLELANKDAAKRLSLRTRISSLAMDDGERADVKAKLDAIDRREADALAALKNRDQQTLATLNAELRASMQKELDSEAGRVQSKTLAKLKARETELRTSIAAGAPFTTHVENGKLTTTASAALPAAVRAKIEALHADYQKQFNADAQATIEAFNRTRDDLKARYAQLHAADASAASGGSAQIAELTKKREDLYAQILEQIGREVRLIAQQKGVSVVVTDPIATTGGVDLTPDALKDIESLHE